MAHDHEEEREDSESEFNDQVLEVLNNRRMEILSENNENHSPVFIATAPDNNIHLVARQGIYSLNLRTGIILRVEDSEMTEPTMEPSQLAPSRNSNTEELPRCSSEEYELSYRDIPAPSRQEVAVALGGIDIYQDALESTEETEQGLTDSQVDSRTNAPPENHGAYSEGALAEKDHSNFKKTGKSVSADDLDDLFNKIDEDIKENRIPEAKE